VDLAARHPGALKLRGELLRQRVGTAQEDLAALDVRGDRAQPAGVEPRRMTATSALSGSSCSSARIGAVPTPAPMSSRRSRSAVSAVKAP